MGNIINAILLWVFVSSTVSVFAYDGDVEIFFDNGFNNESNKETTIPINEFLEFTNKDWRRSHAERNIKEYMSHYHNPNDDELAIRIMFYGNWIKLGQHRSHFCPTAEERIDMLEYLISEGRIIPHVVMSRCYTGDLVSTLCPDERTPPDGLVLNQKAKHYITGYSYDVHSVCKWLFSKCAQVVQPIPDSKDNDEWYDVLREMRSLSIRQDRVGAYKTLQKIFKSDDITEDEKAAMKQLYEEKFRQNSMMIFFL